MIAGFDEFRDRPPQTRPKHEISVEVSYVRVRYSTVPAPSYALDAKHPHPHPQLHLTCSLCLSQSTWAISPRPRRRAGLAKFIHTIEPLTLLPTPTC